MRRSRIVLAAAAGLVIAGGGTAVGATVTHGPVDSEGVIHGCWSNASRNGGHTFVLEDQGSRCPRGTTAISWNKTGPAGPRGPQGATGDTGPAGQDGTNGTNGTDGKDGANGADGVNGTNGKDGASVLNGQGAPDAGAGTIGDFYIDTTAKAIYGPRSAAGWGSPTSLVGPKGDPGAPGTAGQNASLRTKVVSVDVFATADQIQVWDVTGQGGSITRTVTCPADYPLAVAGSVSSDHSGDGPLGDNSYQRSSWTATMSWVYVRANPADIHFQLTCLGA